MLVPQALTPHSEGTLASRLALFNFNPTNSQPSTNNANLFPTSLPIHSQKPSSITIMAAARADESQLAEELFAGLTFFVVQRVPLRSALLRTIESHGGRVVLLERQADHIIADHMRPDAPPGSISFTFIEAAVRADALPDPQHHRAGRPAGTVRAVGSSTVPIKDRRTRFSAEDDRVLWQWVETQRQQGARVKGNAMYLELERRNPRHTSQSWRDRYINKLMANPPPGVNVAVPANPPPTPPVMPDADDAIALAEEEPLVFTHDEREKMMENAGDIENMDTNLTDRAWECWASVFTSHSAAAWRSFWEEDVRPAYLRNQARASKAQAEAEGSSDKKPPVSNSEAYMANRSARQVNGYENEHSDSESRTRKRRIPTARASTDVAHAHKRLKSDEKASPGSHGTDELPTQRRTKGKRGKPVLERKGSMDLDSGALCPESPAGLHASEDLETMPASKQELRRRSQERTDPIRSPRLSASRATRHSTGAWDQGSPPAVSPLTEANLARQEHEQLWGLRDPTRDQDDNRPATAISEAPRPSSANYPTNVEPMETLIDWPASREDSPSNRSFRYDDYTSMNSDMALEKFMRNRLGRNWASAGARTVPEEVDAHVETIEKGEDGDTFDEDTIEARQARFDQEVFGRTGPPFPLSSEGSGDPRYSEGSNDPGMEPGPTTRSHPSQTPSEVDFSIPEPSRGWGSLSSALRHQPTRHSPPARSGTPPEQQTPSRQLRRRATGRDSTTRLIAGFEVQASDDSGVADVSEADIPLDELSAEASLDELAAVASLDELAAEAPLEEPGSAMKRTAGFVIEDSDSYVSDDSYAIDVSEENVLLEELAADTPLEEPGSATRRVATRRITTRQSAEFEVEASEYSSVADDVSGAHTPLEEQAADAPLQEPSSATRRIVTRQIAGFEVEVSDYSSIADDVPEADAPLKELAALARGGPDTQAILDAETQLPDLSIPPIPDLSDVDDVSEADAPLKELAALARGGPDTQAILDAETQLPDLSIPPMPDLSEVDEGVSAPASPVSASQTHDSAHPRRSDDAPAPAPSAVAAPAADEDDLDAYVDAMRVRGHDEAAVVHALRCASLRPELAELVLLEAKWGKGLPADVPGVWSPREDAVLEGSDARALRRLEEKHGWDECEARLRFLEMYRGEGGEDEAE